LRAEYQAFIVHRTPTRLRIKIPDWRCHDAHFAALQRALLSHSDVVHVGTNALAASVVIYCREGFDIGTIASQFGGMKVISSRGGILSDVQWRNPEKEHTILWPNIALLLIKILVAILTKQLPSQLVEWGLDALLREAAQPANWNGRRSPRLVQGARPLLLPVS
jgi:hypothetical protein